MTVETNMREGGSLRHGGKITGEIYFHFPMKEENGFDNAEKHTGFVTAHPFQ